MNSPIKKIALILVLIILLPVLFFSLYEINTLNESEKVIEEAYKNQLDAILFSVNQFSDDVVSAWRSKLNSTLQEEVSAPGFFKEKTDSLLKTNDYVVSVLFSDSLNAQDTFALPADYSYNIKALLNSSYSKIKRLYTYERGGYNKVEPVSAKDSSIFLIFLLDDPVKRKNICVTIIDPIKFINNVLSTKLREIAEDEFIITCQAIGRTSSNISSRDVIFSTGEFQNRYIQQKRNLWLMPDYELGILLESGTIETLVKERATTSIIFILLLTMVLIIGVIIVFRNIRKEMELARIKSDFVSNVSHELRTPLALITMFAETLEMDRAKTEEKKKEYYTIISKEAGRLSRIVNKILSFSKIEAGKKEYRFTKIDINNLVEDIFKTYEFHLQNKGFKFSFKRGDSTMEIDADPEAVSEAVINLLDNAVKYSNDRKEVAISTGKEGNFVYVEISDKGIGIREESQKKIFDKFYRVSNGLVHNTKGTGLGLTLVKHIMDAHYGEVKIKSKPNEGSSFKLIFSANNIEGDNK
jgi:two-component system phosphate regulon sensor histidine kinase PhoR